MGASIKGVGGKCLARLPLNTLPAAATLRLRFIWSFHDCSFAEHCSIYNVKNDAFPKFCRSTFIFCSSRKLYEGAHFLHLACQGGQRAPLASRQLRHWEEHISWREPRSGWFKSVVLNRGGAPPRGEWRNFQGARTLTCSTNWEFF